MRPEVTQLLQMTGMQLPGLVQPTAFGVGTATLMTGLLMISAQEYDRAAETRVADNAEMRALFANLAPRVKDAALRKELEDAAASKDASLRISVLNAAGEGLRRILIRLQTHAEDEADREAQKQIWDVLKASCDRRMLSAALS
jgi:hypothetical protein